LNPIAIKVFNVKVKSTPIGMCDMSLQDSFYELQISLWKALLTQKPFEGGMNHKIMGFITCEFQNQTFFSKFGMQ